MVWVGVVLGWFGGPGGDRLSRTLGCSIMGAGGFHVRVRDGIGCSPAAMATRLSEPTPRNGFVVAWSGSGMGECVRLCWFCCGLIIDVWMIAVHGGVGCEPIGRLGPVS